MIERVRDEFFSLLLAIEFLTRVPAAPAAAWSEQRFRASVRHYPLVGLLIGCCAATVYAGTALFLPSLPAIILSVAATLMLTGAFHEDGLADTFDGIGGGLSADRSLEIMRDSRIGVYGATALFIALALKVSVLNSLDSTVLIVTLIAAHGLSRWSSVLVIATSRYVRTEGTGKPTADGIGFGALIYSTAIAVAAIALLCICTSPTSAAAAAAGLLVGHGLMRLYFERYIRGYTGDTLGATQQASEIGLYIGVLACQ